MTETELPWLAGRPDWRALAARRWPSDRVEGDGRYGLRHVSAPAPWPHPAAVTELFETAEEASLAEARASLHWLTHPDPYGEVCPVKSCAGHSLVTVEGDGS